MYVIVQASTPNTLAAGLEEKGKSLEAMPLPGFFSVQVESSSEGQALVTWLLRQTSVEAAYLKAFDAPPG